MVKRSLLSGNECLDPGKPSRGFDVEDRIEGAFDESLVYFSCGAAYRGALYGAHIRGGPIRVDDGAEALKGLGASRIIRSAEISCRLPCSASTSFN